MAKNIVILLDGTSNEIKTNRSNILRLYGTLAKGPGQIVYYDPGVGTFGADNAWSRSLRKGAEVWGMATGWGMDANIKEAYRFLAQHYARDAEGNRDRIHIFGFSRGAYAARVLAGFVHAFGLIAPANLNLLDYAYHAYKQISERRGDDSFAEIRLFERILRPDRAPIRLLGLFDTVASVIESGRFGPRLRKHAFTDTNPSVEAVRHAVAIDERRTMYRAELWPEGRSYRANPFGAEIAEQDVREVWFNGVHGDIGGGYPEAEAALAKLPLKWMIDETKAMGLEFKTRSVNELVLGQRTGGPYVAPDPQAARHESLCGAWHLLEYLPRRKTAGSQRPDLGGWTLPQGERRPIPEGAWLHGAVIARMEQTGARPANLPKSWRVAP